MKAKRGEVMKKPRPLLALPVEVFTDGDGLRPVLRGAQRQAEFLVDGGPASDALRQFAPAVVPVAAPRLTLDDLLRAAANRPPSVLLERMRAALGGA